MSTPKWFWAHRRNSSLHHMSFLMHGLAGKGWAPAVNFWFDNQAFVGVPGKGIYIFYDQNQLSSEGKFRDVQESIDSNAHFVADFKKRSDVIFGTLFELCKECDDLDLKNCSNEQLATFYKRFLEAFMVAPIISVQLWGIEACFDTHYRIMQFLRNRLEELGKGRDFELYKGVLSVNTGETVAFTEQKDFYRTASEIANVPELAEVFAGDDAHAASEALRAFPTENEAFEAHAKKYEWMQSEYVGETWSREKWIALFQKAFHESQSPGEKLASLIVSFDEANAERQKIIKELNPPTDVRHAIDALAEFIAQRDWTKGYFTKILLSYHRLLDEIAQRNGLSREDVFNYSYQEVQELVTHGTKIGDAELALRKKEGFVVIIHDGIFSLITEKEEIPAAIEREGLSEPFGAVVGITEFKGMPASRGHITGRVRVLEDASRISELEKGEILVTYMTTIEFIPAFRKAAAVVTDEGGMSCHAAIISREFKLPCIVGTKVATRALSTGDFVEVDAVSGIVRILEHKTT